MLVKIVAIDHVDRRMGSWRGIQLTPEPGEKGSPHLLIDGKTGGPAHFHDDRSLNRAMYAMKEPDKWLKTVK